MKSLLGYTNKLTVRPGQDIEFKISSDESSPYTAQLVRLISGDTHSEQANFKEIELASPINGEYIGRKQPINQGSCVVVDRVRPLDTMSEFSLTVNFMPTTPFHGRQHLLSRWDENTQTGWSLHLTPQGQLAFTTSDDQGQTSTLAIEKSLQARHWYRAAVRVSWNGKTLALNCIPLAATATQLMSEPSGKAQGGIQSEIPTGLPSLLMAAAFRGRDAVGRVIPTACFNGRLEAPVIYRGLLNDAELAGIAAGERPAALSHRLIADWHFSDGIDATGITDRSPNRLHGRTHNLPLRAVKSSQWDGSAMAWHQAPDHYGAIHFHSDDLYDCGWLTDITYRVADDARSGIYALRLRQNGRDEEEYLPFFIAAPKHKPQAKVAFIVPTYTYLAYGNLHVMETDLKGSRLSKAEMQDLEKMMGPGTEHYFRLIEEHPELAGSTYNTHIDGSPVHFSSWLRPLLNMRPKTILWTLCADLLITDWLEAKGFDYDIITDDLLQEEGVDVLNHYQVVMSGNHPEYPTTAQLDAIQAYTDQGGRFMYMGGNGYYWRIAVNETLPGVIEVRRGRTGTGTWESEPGESYLAFSGEMGGILRDIGRPPQQLLGVGFIAQGSGASYYRVLPEAREGRAAFILEGVNDEVIGDFGLLGGGAAGQEIDQTNFSYGTPAHTIVLARSENHGADMVFVIEEMEGNIPLAEYYQTRVYSEVIFFETPNGGAVFAVGSMAWCGSLSHNGYDNNISRITANVLTRFCDPVL